MTALTVAGREVGRYGWDRAGLPGTVPRPALHPLRTLRGTPVTGAHPPDHPWHFGLGIALPDVAGVNLWGGPSYVRGRGYADAERGVVRERAPARTGPGTVAHGLRWCDASGTALLSESRRLRCGGGADGCWWLEWSSVLTPAGTAPVPLGSPGSAGRTGAGYGGFFWRLPEVSPGRARVFTAEHRGEDRLNGAPARWLALAVDDGAASWTAVLSGVDDRTRRDPWFVRAGEYLGVGSSLAWDRPLWLRPGRSLPITVRVVLADGLHDRDAVPDLLARAGS